MYLIRALKLRRDPLDSCLLYSQRTPLVLRHFVYCMGAPLYCCFTPFSLAQIHHELQCNKTVETKGIPHLEAIEDVDPAVAIGKATAMNVEHENITHENKTPREIQLNQSPESNTSPRDSVNPGRMSWPAKLGNPQTPEEALAALIAANEEDTNKQEKTRNPIAIHHSSADEKTKEHPHQRRVSNDKTEYQEKSARYSSSASSLMVPMSMKKDMQGIADSMPNKEGKKMKQKSDSGVRIKMTKENDKNLPEEKQSSPKSSLREEGSSPKERGNSPGGSSPKERLSSPKERGSSLKKKESSPKGDGLSRRGKQNSSRRGSNSPRQFGSLRSHASRSSAHGGLIKFRESSIVTTPDVENTTGSLPLAPVIFEIEITDEKQNKSKLTVQ